MLCNISTSLLMSDAQLCMRRQLHILAQTMFLYKFRWVIGISRVLPRQTPTKRHFCWLPFYAYGSPRKECFWWMVVSCWITSRRTYILSFEVNKDHIFSLPWWRSVSQIEILVLIYYIFIHIWFLGCYVALVLLHFVIAYMDARIKISFHWPWSSSSISASGFLLLHIIFSLAITITRQQLKKIYSH